jgi:hypothetical protein
MHWIVIKVYCLLILFVKLKLHELVMNYSLVLNTALELKRGGSK